MQEIWRTIQDFPNYQVSNLGNVKHIKNGLLQPQKTIFGYLSVILYKMDKNRKKTIKKFRVNRLVLSTFCPVRNMKNLQVNHLDKNRKNNNLNNLEWTTAKENSIHKHKTIEKYYNSISCYDKNGKYFNSYREAGKYYNISPNTVKRDILGLTKRTEKNRMTFFKEDPTK